MSLPDPYTPELAFDILERLADGQTLREVCRAEGMPARSTVNKWIATNREGFADHYARAREAGLHSLADETVEIADDGTNDWVERENQRTGQVQILCDTDHVQRSKLRVDTRKWLLSKLMPKTYGDRLEVEHKGNVTVEHRLAAGRRRVASG